MYQIGDLVCYPMHGISAVESIVTQQVMGEKKQYYVLRYGDGRMTAMIPVENADAVGLRLPISREECPGVIAYLKNGEYREESANWNQRNRDNMELLRRGDVFSVADVVKTLGRRDREKGLSSGERKVYNTARQVLAGELCAAGGYTAEEAEALMDD